MQDMQMNNPNPPQINLESTTEQIPLKSRKDRSQQRQNDFYEELKKAQTVELNNVEPEQTIAVEEEENIESEPLETQQSDQQENQLDNKVIPKKRLDKEIEARKALENSLQQEREARIKIQTELEMYNKAISSLQEKESKKEEPDIDPVDSDAHNLYMREINSLKQQVQKQNTHTTESEQRQRFENTVNAQASQFMQSNTDFNDAYNYLLNVKTKEAELQGYEGSEAQQVALAAIQPIAWQVYNKGGNVAEAAYKLAQNYGYKTNTNKKVSSSPNLDKVSQNMAKSHSILDEVPSAPTSLRAEESSLLTLEGFERKLAGKFGRGTNLEAFNKALTALRSKG